MLKNPSNFVPLAPTGRGVSAAADGVRVAPQPKQPAQPATFESLTQAFGAPEGKVILLYGDKALFKFSMLLAAQSAYNAARGGNPSTQPAGKPVALIDGCNRFDLHAVTRFAREHGADPQLLLQKLFISRGFTCYQMEAAVTTKLQTFFRKTGASRAFVFGLLDTFYDEQAPAREVRQILVRVLRAFEEMKRQNISLLLSCTEWNVLPEERNRLIEQLKHNADGVYRLAPNDKAQLQLFGEKLLTNSKTNRKWKIGLLTMADNR
jgi:hypothetical protein